jgi:hypothetical protein
MRRDSDCKTERGLRRGRRRVLWVLLLVGVASGSPCWASPIRHHHKIRSASTSNPSIVAWNTFLHGGPTHWARVEPPTIGAEIHRLMNHGLKSANPTSDLNVEYLMWRRSLDPPRFDSFHPRVGRALQSMLTPTSVIPSTNPGGTPQAEQIGPPPPSTPSSSTGHVTSPSSSTPQNVTPPPSSSPAPEAIPEPETVTIALTLIGSGLCWRYFAGRSANSTRVA